MTPKNLYMVREEAGGHEWLTDDPKYYADARPAEPSDLTIEAMAELMDHEAENCNAHDFCGLHKRLAKLLLQHGVGNGRVKAILRRLIDFDGLYGLNGVCGKGPGDDEIDAALNQ